MPEWILNAINIVIGFRKFIVITLLYSVSIYMRFNEQISGDQFVTLLKSTTIAYFGANFGEHATMAFSNRQKPEEVKSGQ